jgi:hypothetical protein
MDFITENWEKIALVALVIQNVVKGIRDAVDTTPQSDDNMFEKISTFLSKVTGYLIGFRPRSRK